MEKPVEPLLSQFCLDERIYSRCNTILKLSDNFSRVVGILTFVIPCYFIFLPFFASKGLQNINSLLLMAVFLLGPLVCIFYSSLVMTGIRFLIFCLWPNLKLSDRFNKAHKRYEQCLKAYNNWWVRTQKEYWCNLPGHQFEHELASLFCKSGLKARVTRGSGDGGVDIILENDGKIIVVQCKRYAKPVGPSVVRELYGAMQHFNANEAVLACTGGFTKGVFDFVKNKPIKLMSIDDILDLQQKSLY